MIENLKRQLKQLLKEEREKVVYLNAFDDKRSSDFLFKVRKLSALRYKIRNVRKHIESIEKKRQIEEEKKRILVSPI